MPELVRVVHPEVGEALVPPSALRQLNPAWKLAEDDEPATPAPDQDDKPARRPRKGTN